MFEAIKDIGSFLGIVTFIFTVYDRSLAGRPIISLAILPYHSEKRPYIRIKNNSKHDVFIRNVVVYPGDTFLICRTDDIEDMLKAWFKENQYLVISPGSELSPLLFARPSKVRRFKETRDRIQIYVSWRKTRSTWLPQFPLRMTIDAQEMEKLLGTSSAYKDDPSEDWIPDE